MAGWVRKSFSAAREKLRSLTTVAKTCSAWSSMAVRQSITNAYPTKNNYKFAKSGPQTQG